MTTRYAEAGDRPLAPEKEPNDRSILIGLVGTVLFHIVLVVLSPHVALVDFAGSNAGLQLNNQPRGQTFDFELADTVPEKPRNPFNFVETNPDAPENTPDKTDNFSNRDQQAAQKEAPKELDELKRPSIADAQDKIKNDMSIVTGDMSEPEMGAAARPESTQTAEVDQKEQKLRMEQVPLSGFDKTEGTSEDGIATNVADAKKPSTHADQNLEGARDGKEAEGGLLATTAAQRAQPKARPRLTAPRSTVLTNRTTGVANIGIQASDAFKSEYGEYLQELIEIIQAQWYRILDESRVSPPRGSHVVITFKLNSKGETDIIKVEDADAGKQGVFSCQNAIQARQPYRKWTDQMIALLGEEQTLTFAFYYMH